ncbi:sulfurtransferase TusA family protein [Poseidonocella sp. HB161398]|uniref:sulfurtransferase TusA family protein n=1 Tax=Poseidonocella sp. HB161398 TaxID=2320855 RepID=UPI001107AB33|nr:sulfurtransferase TusA family protein [Poseidonocella sp. HB161398]
MSEIGNEETWDAGPLGCGELAVLLRLRLKRMPGQVLRLVATDPGAPDDIPAWCRMTRNSLLRHDPATNSFWIRSREDWT